VIVDAEKLGFKLVGSEAKELAELGVKITKYANEQIGFNHPTNKSWNHISFCLFAGKINREGNKLFAKSAVAVEPGKIDRSPTGTAVSARMALLYSNGVMKKNDILECESIIGSNFTGKILNESFIGGVASITPEITGRAWITGTHQYTLDPTDPWPTGYRLSDTWPMAK
jgi:proline racemase